MTSRQYHEFVIYVPDESREALISKLTDMGTVGLIEKPGHIVAYFEGRRDVTVLSGELSEFRTVLRSSGLNPDISFTCSSLPSQDWNEEWKKGLGPVEIGRNLVIIPSWLSRKTNRLEIIIDSAMAFGTGHHETTRMCLVLMEKYAGENRGKSFLDVGTGTGILAIGALKMGFGSAAGIDTDDVAVETAERNAALNDIGDIVFMQGDISTVGNTFDFITANLLADILVKDAPHISDRLSPGGTAVLSGMLAGQEGDVIKAMEKAGLVFTESVDENRWVSLVFSKPR